MTSRAQLATHAYWALAFKCHDSNCDIRSTYTAAGPVSSLLGFCSSMALAAGGGVRCNRREFAMTAKEETPMSAPAAVHQSVR